MHDIIYLRRGYMFEKFVKMLDGDILLKTCEIEKKCDPQKIDMRDIVLENISEKINIVFWILN